LTCRPTPFDKDSVGKVAIDKTVDRPTERTRILADIATLPQLPHKPTKTPAPEGYRYELSGSGEWVDTGIPGFRTKLLSRGRHPGCEVMLIALAPGAKLFGTPFHRASHGEIQNVRNKRGF
jgi:hypothetical protein